MYTPSPYERETVIQMDDSSKIARICTRQKRIMRQLEKLLSEKPDDVHLVKRYSDGTEIQVTVPRTWIRIGPPKRMNLSDEQRKAIAERLRLAKTQHELFNAQQCNEN